MPDVKRIARVLGVPEKEILPPYFTDLGGLTISGKTILSRGAELFLTPTVIAGLMGCTVDAFWNSAAVDDFHSIFSEGASLGYAIVMSAQRTLCEDGNAVMLQHVGKTYCGQKDTIVQEIKAPSDMDIDELTSYLRKGRALNG